MPSISPKNTEELRRLVHEMSEALTAIGAFLSGHLRSDDRDKEEEAIVRAMEQVQRADHSLALLRRLANAL